MIMTVGTYIASDQGNTDKWLFAIKNPTDA